MELSEKPDKPVESPSEAPKEEKKNAFLELTTAMKEKRQSLMDKIDEIKELREKLQGMNRISVRTLSRRKEQLEFKIATEALTLDKERAFMKTIKGIDQEIKQAQSRESERSKILGKIKALDGEIEKLKNELDEMKLNLIKLRDERKKRRLDFRKRREEREAVSRPKPAPKKDEELIISLEDIAVMKKGSGNN